ncbi:MAG: sigma-70 family RNA polymerase sigma factor [Bryobacteraceae bacterium]|nr:sigma-70 family RNA polymerase sigma factor [Bryobacteraceae bacterium]
MLPPQDYESAPSCPGDITVLLRQVSGGVTGAHDQLMDLLYPDLKRLAEYRMNAERSDHTLQATALVNEFFLHIAKARGIDWRDRMHFLAVASQAMRRFLIDYARSHNSERRGGKHVAVQLELLELVELPCDAVVIGQVLDRLASEEPRMAQVVDMRCFGGLTHGEIAQALGIDERTVKRDWKVARAWLAARLQEKPADDEL